MSRTSSLVIVAATAFALIGPASSTPVTSSAPTSAPAGNWVVESVHYSGPRGENLPGGTGEHYVTCIPAVDLALDYTQREHWREIRIPAEHAYDDTYDTGVPCPAGEIRLSSEQGR
jgi:hypothetical protein